MLSKCEYAFLLSKHIYIFHAIVQAYVYYVMKWSFFRLKNFSKSKQSKCIVLFQFGCSVEKYRIMSEYF